MNDTKTKIKIFLNKYIHNYIFSIIGAMVCFSLLTFRLSANVPSFVTVTKLIDGGTLSYADTNLYSVYKELILVEIVVLVFLLLFIGSFFYLTIKTKKQDLEKTKNNKDLFKISIEHAALSLLYVVFMVYALKKTGQVNVDLGLTNAFNVGTYLFLFFHLLVALILVIISFLNTRPTKTELE